jgi:glycosyltransferase involved in cell wall biosynthesis
MPRIFEPKPKDDFYLFVGRLAASKHADLVIEACNTLKKKLIVVGSGKGLPYLEKLAGSTIVFAGSISDEALDDLYARAKLLIYPAEDEDFGMIAVEAMAHGTPAVVHRSGGFLESVVENKTGIFINELTVDGVIDAIARAEKTQWNARAIYDYANRFSADRFKKEMTALIEQAVKQKRS